MQVRVEQIDALVHPGYLLKPLPHIPLIPRQTELEQAWIDEAQGLSKKEAVLVCFSQFTQSALNDLMSGLSSPRNQFEKQEIERLRTLQSMLGRRFFLFGEHISNDSFGQHSMERRGFSYAPEFVQIRVYGEILEMCVQAKVNWLSSRLNVPTFHITTCPELSLNLKDYYQWSDALEGCEMTRSSSGEKFRMTSFLKGVWFGIDFKGVL